MLLATAWPTFQSPLPAQTTAPQATSDQTPEPTLPDGPTAYTLHVSAREVELDIIARDKNDRPIKDLKQSDFQIFELPPKSPKQQRRIASLVLNDPATKAAAVSAPSGGFHVALRGGCATGVTAHYQLSFQPSSVGWASGYHEILVTTTRPHTTLTYRHKYYVAQNDMPPSTKPTSDTADYTALSRAACYYPDVPASLGLQGQRVLTAANNVTRYSVVIQPDSLVFSSINDSTHRVDLDYGVCTFSAEGKALKFLSQRVAKVLSPAAYQEAQEAGFPNNVAIPLVGDPVLVRFVVRDRATGNLGIIDLPTEQGEQADKANTEVQPKDVSWNLTDHLSPLSATQSSGTFGSIIPKHGSLCGDVYEVPPGTPKLISNFGEQDSVGMIYTYNLKVAPQRLTVPGLPGASPYTEWFSIDYYGEFWTKVEGKYKFHMVSDDGAKLYIDDQLLIVQDGIHAAQESEEAIALAPGRHTIHLPYFQGPNVVSLVLQVKPPGSQSMEIFDTRNFPQPTDNTPSTHP